MPILKTAKKAAKKPSKKSLENLKKGKAKRFRTGDEQAKIAKKGGKASGIARAKNRTFAQIGAMVLGLRVGKEVLDKVEVFKTLKLYCPELKDLTLKDFMILAQIAKAINQGDTRAFEAVRDTVGEIIETKTKVAAEISGGNDLSKIDTSTLLEMAKAAAVDLDEV